MAKKYLNGDFKDGQYSELSIKLKESGNVFRISLGLNDEQCIFECDGYEHLVSIDGDKVFKYTAKIEENANRYLEVEGEAWMVQGLADEYYDGARMAKSVLRNIVDYVVPSDNTLTSISSRSIN